MKLPTFFGELLYFLLYPFIYLAIKNSKRVYAVVIVDNHVLIVKNWLGNHKKWRLAGGGLKPRESYLAALVRELKEEVSIESTIDDYSRINMSSSSRSKQQYYQLNLKKLPTLSLQKPEILTARFVKVSDLSKINFDRSVKEVIDCIDWSA